ncbi:hypothetical protein DBR43_09900 [Pedobacter sp. KBW06]|uniref:SusC/RagA family TonB-linked outer membrane protein n=1 Tax=Pedobacter sp. KBW06 TaxID=2153359 RepID=UPI000F5A82A6|nr:SusC/RagA family TonB-linked outer membrane protein [Pedobacter sp. KBW06]RQO75640.1 hypothetical protein DBR43_09900 [Pedobacter sp. KBW06]
MNSYFLFQLKVPLAPHLQRRIKFTVIIMIIGIFQVNASVPVKLITIRRNNIGLKEVFTEIRKQTGYTVLYRSEMIEGIRLINVDLVDASIETVLKCCLKGQSLDFVIEDYAIVITEKKISIKDKIISFLTEVELHCKVVDENEKPLEGATVKVKGTLKITSTNSKGEFVLNNITDKDIILISYLAYKTKEILVKDLRNMSVLKMEPVSAELNEVKINTGYQSLSKQKTVGAFEYLDIKALERRTGQDIISRLEGMTAGFSFKELPGNAVASDENSRNRILIRGLSTMTAGTEPLIVLDNFPYLGDINNINPNDIESVTILKDAVASAIWGVKSGNGVIVLTSKKGRYNQPVDVVFDTKFHFAGKPDLFHFPVMSSKDYIDVERFLYDKGYFDARIRGEDRSKMPLTPVLQLLVDNKKGQLSDEALESGLREIGKNDLRNDYNQYIYRNTLNQQYHVGVNGGTEQQKYGVSVGWNKGVDYKQSLADHLTIKASHTYSFFDKNLEIDAGILYTQKNNQSSYFNSGPRSGFTYLKLKREDGTNSVVDQYDSNYVEGFPAGKLLDWSFSPLDDWKLNNSKVRVVDHQFNVGLRYRLSRTLDVKIEYSSGQGTKKNTNEYDERSFYVRNLINQFTQIDPITETIKRPVPLGGIIYSKNDEYDNKNVRISSSYNYNNQKHGFSFLAGAEMSETVSHKTGNNLYGYNSVSGSSTSVDFANLYPVKPIGMLRLSDGQVSMKKLDRNLSAFLLVTYDYLKKYVLSTSVRNDGSNLFGVYTNNQWNPIWSIGLSWDINQDFFYQVKWLPSLKLRAGYGYNGNVNKTITGHLITYLISNDIDDLFKRQSYATIRNAPNPYLKWEKVGHLNVGIDFSAFNSRLSGSLEYYRKSTSDLIGAIRLAPVFGWSDFSGNTAGLTTSGCDIKINSTNISGQFNWSSNILFSFTSNQVTKYGIIPSEYNSAYVNGQQIIGKPYNLLFSYRWAGLDPLTGNARVFVNGEPSSNLNSILNNTNQDDLVYHGSSVPTSSLSLFNTFNWRQFHFSFNITGQFGYSYRRSSINYSGLLNYSSYRQHGDFSKRWQNPGDEKITNVISMVYPFDSSREIPYLNSNILIEKGDHIRLRDLRIGYTLNRTSRSKLPFKQLQFLCSINNIGFLWRADRTKIDPEVQLNSEFPQPTEVVFGAKVNL